MLTDDLETYSGKGKVYVAEDGRVVFEYSDPARDPDGLLIDDATDHFLISDGKASTLLPPGHAVPPGTTSKVSLDGTGSEIIAQFEGTLIISETSSDWSIEVNDAGSVTIFKYDFDYTGNSSQGTCCSVSCDDGSCSSSADLCWCFCGLGGTPHCFGFNKLFLVASL